MIYTNQTKLIIRQICRYKTIGFPTLNPEQYLELIKDILESKCGLDIYKHDPSGEIRLIIHKKTGQMWKLSKIDNDVLYLTNGEDVISENQLIHRYSCIGKPVENRLINIK